MAVEPPARSLLIVTGSTLRAEELDRPLAYYLKQRIEQPTAATAPNPGPFRVRVVADFRWIHEKKLQALPTISIGGPGVNALARDWLEGGPPTPPGGEQDYIQMGPHPRGGRARNWGGGNPPPPNPLARLPQRYPPQVPRPPP